MADHNVKLTILEFWELCYLTISHISGHMYASAAVELHAQAALSSKQKIHGSMQAEVFLQLWQSMIQTAPLVAADLFLWFWSLLLVEEIKVHRSSGEIEADLLLYLKRAVNGFFFFKMWYVHAAPYKTVCSTNNK